MASFGDTGPANSAEMVNIAVYAVITVSARFVFIYGEKKG